MTTEPFFEELLTELERIEGIYSSSKYRWPMGKDVCPSCGSSLVHSDANQNRDINKHFKSCKLKPLIDRLYLWVHHEARISKFE